MKLFVLLILTVLSSENENDTENDLKFEENPIVVKIEEDECAKMNKKSTYIGVAYNKNISKWRVQRWRKDEKKIVSNGSYGDEKTAAHASDTLARKLMEIGKQNHKLNFPDDHIEVYSEKKSSKFIGVSYFERDSKWQVQRRSKHENRMIFNGCYDNEDTAAHASDTLARKLMENGEQKFKLNFPDDHSEVYRQEVHKSSKYIGVSYNKNTSNWRAKRWNKDEKKLIYNGYYDDEETAARASDTLARNLMKNGEQNHKLNFPEDRTEVYPEKEKESKYIGVSYNKKTSKWLAQRWNKDEKKVVSNGSYDDEETAAHASDTLARNLLKNGERKLKLNFPDDHTENIQKNKRKRPTELGLGNPQIN